MSNRIHSLFQQARPVLIPYLTVGDPDLDTTYQAIKTLAAAGADMIELGVPFTDPIADGPTIQKSSERALQHDFHLDDIFKLSTRLRQDGVAIPFVLMSYANPLYAYGLDRFCPAAVKAGIDALLITDMPPEESEDYLKAARAAELGTVFLASPTTSPERLKMIDEASTAYVYYVARAGVTGARASLPPDLQQQLTVVRKSLRGKLCVGFGLSTAAHVAALAPYADGLIVGSALVDLFEKNQGAALQIALHDFMQDLVGGLGKASHHG
jgi:tryptophan synthase alpha chain